MDNTMVAHPLLPSSKQQHKGQMAMYASAGAMYHAPATLYNNGSVMTPAGSPMPSQNKPAIMLDTDVDSYFPSTPPLSTSGSTVGSPKNFDALQTPMNPMFSGLDDGLMSAMEHPIETSILDWSSSGSPPMTPSKS